jgi:hypothetical protein
MEESKTILDKIKSGEFSYSDHGNDRALERSLSVEDLIHIANNLIRWEWQENIQTHLYIGYRTNGQGAGFSAVLRSDVIIVTIFKRKLKNREKKHA